MIDHMTFRVADIARTRAFYGAVLATLGYAEGYFGAHDGEQVLGYQQAGKFDTWFIQGPSPWGGPPATTGCHLCWRATSRAQVDAPLGEGATTTANHYAGDWNLRCHPATGKAVVVVGGVRRSKTNSFACNSI